MDVSLFTGVWKLTLFEARSSNNAVVYPFGENPFGLLIYCANGSMSVTLMEPNREKFVSDNPRGGTIEEIKAAYNNFDAYCGTYSIQPEDNTIIHHVEASHFPNWTGTDLKRHYEFSDNKLILSAPPIDVHDEQWILSLTWERSN